MPDRLERYGSLFGTDGWHQYIEDAQKSMADIVGIVMSINTTKEGWQDKAAKYINRYQAIREVAINAETNIRNEKIERRKKANQEDSL